MRTVKTFQLGTVMTTGGAEEVTAVAHDGIFSHAHYFRRYPDGDHRQLNAYPSGSEVVDDVLNSCGQGYWRDKNIADLREVGLCPESI